MRYVRVTSATLLTLTLLSCGGDETELGVEFREGHEDVCDADSRATVTSTGFPFSAVGSVSTGCTGYLIAPRKMMTAAHCVNNVAPSNITFSPAFGLVTPGVAPATSRGVRKVMGRDPCVNCPFVGDWSIVTLADDLGSFGAFQRVIPSSIPFTVMGVGYGAPFNQRPASRVGVINVNQDGALWHDVDVVGGDSGMPLFIGGQAVATQSGHALSRSCTGTTGNTAVSAERYAFAPDNAGGITASLTGDGRIEVYTSDLDWTVISTRWKKTIAQSSDWTPWSALDSAFNGRKLSTTTLEDGRQEVFVVNPSGGLQTKWQGAPNGGWVNWVDMATPSSVLDVAAVGRSGAKTFLFVLGTNGTISESHKTGDSGSPWSTWATLGTIPTAKSIGGAFLGTNPHLFVASGSGAHVTFQSGGVFVALQSFGGPFGGFLGMSAGLLKSGLMHVQAITTFGVVQTRTRNADGSWTSWTNLAAAAPVDVGGVGFSAITSGRLPDGGEELFGIVNGEVFTTWESNGAFTQPWIRFY